MIALPLFSVGGIDFFCLIGVIKANQHTPKYPRVNEGYFVDLLRGVTWCLGNVARAARCRLF